MLKHLHQLTVLTVLLLIISAMTVSPVSAQAQMAPAVVVAVPEIGEAIGGAIAVGVAVVGIACSALANKGNDETVAAKWYAVEDITDVTGSSHEISEKEALEKLKKCDDSSIFIQGESREECKKLAEKASDRRIPEEHRLNNYNVKKHQYPHYHPVDANGKKCAPHCFWIP